MLKKKCKYFYTGIAIFISLSLFGQKKNAADSIITGEYHFENIEEIKGWHSASAALSLSPIHYKDGQKSLQWQWDNKAVLEIPYAAGLAAAGSVYAGGIPEIYEPSYYPKGRYGGIKMWLYQEQPASGKMVFQVGADLQAAYKNPKYHFAVNLNFKGWRAVWVCFEEDAKVPGYKGSDALQAVVAFPQNNSESSGKIFIDHLTFLNFVSNKRNSDLQFENHKKNLRSADGYEILSPYQKLLQAAFTLPADKAALASQSEEIMNRLDFLILGDATNDWQKRNTHIEKDIKDKIAAANDLYNKLHLKNENGAVSGLPLFAIRDEHPAAEGMVYDNVAQALLFPLAVDYRLYGNEASGQKVMNALQYFLDQGWAAGSAVGTVDHVIRLTPFATAIFLLRKDLAAAHQLTPLIDMLLWHTRMGSILEVDNTRGENSDKVRGGALVKLITLLLMDNDNKKNQLLQGFIVYMNHIAGIAPGYSDTFKPDYSIYHHRGTYLNSYGTNALNTMALIHWLLQGTPYHMDESATNNIVHALERQAAIAFGVQIHYGVSGRFPLNNSSVDSYSFPAFAFMSMGRDTVKDLRMASLMHYMYNMAMPGEVNKILLPSLTYSGTLGTLNLVVRAAAGAKDSVWQPAQGAVVMPYSALLAYRHNNSFATVKGYNRYVWDYEAGKNENNLGRYVSHGILILANGNEKYGFDSLGLDINNGFDWSMLPGATTKQLPADNMLYYPVADKKYIEGKHRNFSESVIAGGLSQEGNGIFAFDLRDNVFPDADKSLFDNTFRAKKSYFFIGNEIICLGSNINNNDSRYNTVTTLFQYHDGPQKKNYLNGKMITDSVLKTSGESYFTDRNNFSYILPKGQDIVVRSGVQASYKVNKGKYEKTGERFIKAYINHGTRPVQKGYNYEIVTDVATRPLSYYGDGKTYTVLRKDEAAHIITHKNANITAYAIYKPDATLPGPLLQSNIPVMAMVKQTNGTMLLTIANPDIQQPRWNHNMSHMPDSITNAMAAGAIVSVTINGEWYPARQQPKLYQVKINKGNTFLSFFCRDGESIDFLLQQRTGAGDEEE